MQADDVRLPVEQQRHAREVADVFEDRQKDKEDQDVGNGDGECRRQGEQRGVHG